MAAVIVHGGACKVPDSIADACIVGCEAARDEAYSVLNAGKSALDAGTSHCNSLANDITWVG